MSQSIRFFLYTITCFICISIVYWYTQKPDHTTIQLVDTPTRIISDLANPFASGGEMVNGSGNDNQKIIPDSSPSPKPVKTNLTWTGRTLSGVYYQFGSGNPIETDKTSAEITKLYRECTQSCDSILGSQEFVSSITLSDGTEGLSTPPRVTPETERLLYEFLSNPIIRQSAESCSEKFFTYGQAYSVFGSVIGETIPENWWNPYVIDINNFLTVNPQTGRKELNTEPIHLLKQQLNIPSTLVGGIWWTNIPLRDCLEKNNQLSILLNHVNLSLSRLEQEYRSGK